MNFPQITCTMEKLDHQPAKYLLFRNKVLFLSQFSQINGEHSEERQEMSPGWKFLAEQQLLAELWACGRMRHQTSLELEDNSTHACSGGRSPH